MEYFLLTHLQVADHVIEIRQSHTNGRSPQDRTTSRQERTVKKLLLLVMVITISYFIVGCNDDPTGTVNDNTPSENTNGDNSPGGNGGDNPPDNGDNRAPTAYAGDDQTVTIDDTVTLDGSMSNDRDGDELSYNWQFTSRPDGSDAALSNKAVVSPSFKADKEGQYIVELTVNDGKAAATDSVIITASAGQTTSDCSEIVPGENIADDFVCAHNAVRANPQPTPSPALPEVTWDPALAKIAQDYAQICKWGHNNHRSDTYPEYVGENIYASYGMTTTPADAVESWADEAQYYDYDTNTCQEGEMCGHYTQIVWRESVKIGCAQVKCPTLTGLGWRNADYIVCNYAPGGNYMGEKPY